MNYLIYLLMVVCLGVCNNTFGNIEPEESPVSVMTVEVHPGTTFIMGSRIPRGFSRIGSYGYGELYGFSFGSIFPQCSNETTIVEGRLRMLKSDSGSYATWKPKNNVKDFHHIEIFLIENSRKLVRLKFYSYQINAEQIRRLYREVKEHIEYALGMSVSKWNRADGDHAIVLQSIAEDKNFMVVFTIRRIPNGDEELELSITSKKIVEQISSGSECSNPMEDDLQINVGDL